MFCLLFKEKYSGLLHDMSVGFFWDRSTNKKVSKSLIVSRAGIGSPSLPPSQVGTYLFSVLRTTRYCITNQTTSPTIYIDFIKFKRSS